MTGFFSLALTSDYQMQWRGVTLGSGTPYGLRSLEGWTDLPSMRVGLPARSGRHGAHAGQFLAEHRTVTAQFVLAARRSDFQDQVRELRRVTASVENAVEEPLVVRWDGRTQMVRARCVRRSIPATHERYPQGFAVATIQWQASDPRLLQLPPVSTSTALPAPTSSGLVFPLVFPLVFGEGQSGGSMQMYNDGNSTAWPVFTIRGPATAPRIFDATSGDSLEFAADYTVPDGQSIDIDTNLRTVTVSGSTVSRNTELVTREWFGIPAGEQHEIRFTAGTYESEARLSATWNHTDL